MTAVAAFLARLNPTWQAITALAGAAAVGIVVGGATVGFTGLPEQVEVNAQAIEAHILEPWHEGIVPLMEASDEAIMARLNRLICLQTLPDSLTYLEAERACP